MGYGLPLGALIAIVILVVFIELNYPGGSAGLLSQIQ